MSRMQGPLSCLTQLTLLFAVLLQFIPAPAQARTPEQQAAANMEQARIAGPKKFLDRLQAITPPFAVMPRTRSLALRLARVAEGTFDAAIAGGNSHDWDLAAADLLVHEAGGALTSFEGGTVTYNRPVPRHGTLVAAGRDRHAALIELFRDERLVSL